MRLSRRRRWPFAIIVAIPTALVAIILAGLLYRWSNEVSEATSVRLADSLQMSMVNWHLNLYRDVSDVCLALRVDASDGAAIDQYPRRLMEWRATSSYPDLVKALYVVRASPGLRNALRLDFSTARFEPSALPAIMQASSQPIAAASKPAAADSRFADALSPIAGLAGWRFDPDSLALVRSVGADWIVVELDKQVIAGRILPDLARRYFMGVDSLDYMVAVVDGDSPRQVIYSSDSGFGGEDIPDADGRMDVFGGATRKKFGSSLYVFHKLAETGRASQLAATLGTAWFPLTGDPANERSWELIVRHRRGGALGAFVTEMHRRDLAIAFGVLLLLLLTVTMSIVASQRAHRLARLQVDFVTAVSHELRSPLTIISSAAENIAHGVVEDKRQIVQYGSVIEGQARHLSRLVEGILLFAAARENRQRYQMKRLDVAGVVDDALAATADLIAASKVQVEKEIPPNVPQVNGDAAALSQCLQNLITNALKYGGDRKWLGIRVSAPEDGNSKRSGVRIEISDRGMGIDARDLLHIFEPFYRGESAAAAQIHGTGLGLPLAKSIAEAMQGDISVVSSPGEGSTFTLHLPRA